MNNAIDYISVYKQKGYSSIKIPLIVTLDGNYKFENIENCTPKISIDEQNEISITLQVVVKDDVIIKDLANSLQNKVKEEMKKTSDLDVKNVNIKIINMSKKTNENKE